MRVCVVKGCNNSTYTLNKWLHSHCDIHGGDPCTCVPPFRLFPFPTSRKDHEARLRWIQLVNKNNENGMNWQPKTDCRVCSKHFPDSEPTLHYPDPVLKLEYYPIHAVNKPIKPQLPSRNKEATMCMCTCTCKRNKLAATVGNYRLCTKCSVKQKKINILTDKVGWLEEEVKSLNVELKQISSKQLFRSTKVLTNDRIVQNLTGLCTKEHLQMLLGHVEPKVIKIRNLEAGKKKVVSTKVKLRDFLKCKCKSKLTVKDELVLVLMKLRLGLSIAFLALLFGLKNETCSRMFKTWIKFLAVELKPLVFWPDHEMVTSLKSKEIQQRFPRMKCILDCIEVLFEPPRYLQLQAVTWSEYKEHNTIKVLVGIAPNGMITYLSQAWGGRASDNNIVRKSGFLDFVEPGDSIMVGEELIPIEEDLMQRQAVMELSPPGGGEQQMIRDQAINQLKCFQVLKNMLPISLVPYIDDIFTVCAALCNMLPAK